MCLWLTRSAIPAVLSGQHQFLVFATMAGVIVQIASMSLTYWLWGDPLAVVQSLRTSGIAAQPLPFLNVSLWAVGVFVVVPALLAQLFSFALEWERVQPILTLFGKSKVQLTPQSWDWFFCTQERGCWVVAELNDGSLVGGPYGENSFASLSPHAKDLYLEEAYSVTRSPSAGQSEVAHEFGDRVADSIGVWVNGDNAKALYFYRVEGA